MSVNDNDTYSDLSIDTDKMKYGILESITYPEGGTATFEFEPHTFYNATIGGGNGGGLRIKSIIHDENIAENPNRIQSFEYYDPENSRTSGQLMSYPVYVYPFVYRIVPEVSTPFQRWMVSSKPVYPSGNSASGQAVGYDVVSVITGTYNPTTLSTNVTSKTTYKYENMPDLSQIGSIYFFGETQGMIARQPNAPFNSHIDNGKVLEVIDYEKLSDGSFKMIRKVENNYSGLQTVSAIRASALNQYDGPNLKGLVNTALPLSPCSFLTAQRFEIGIKKSKLLSTTTTTFDDANNESVTKVAYQYEDSFEFFAGKDSYYYQYNNDEKRIEERYNYAFEYADGIDAGIDDLKNNNVFGALIETVVSENKELTQGNQAGNPKVKSGVIVKYTDSGYPKPKEVYAMEVDNPIDAANYSTPKVNGKYTTIFPTENAQENYYQKKNYSKYDSYGNLVETAREDGTPITYIWHYTHRSPIVNVVGASYENVAYTSFEKFQSEKWVYNDQLVVENVSDAKTGDDYYGMNNDPIGAISWNTLNQNKRYTLTFWAKDGTVNIVVDANGGFESIATNEPAEYNGWKYYEYKVYGTDEITINGTAKIDELRMFPAQAKMSSMTYEPHKGMTSVCDARNIVSYYEYDDLGRVKLIRDFEGNIVKKYYYNYAE